MLRLSVLASVVIAATAGPGKFEPINIRIVNPHYDPHHLVKPEDVEPQEKDRDTPGPVTIDELRPHTHFRPWKEMEQAKEKAGNLEKVLSGSEDDKDKKDDTQGDKKPAAKTAESGQEKTTGLESALGMKTKEAATPASLVEGGRSAIMRKESQIPQNLDKYAKTQEEKDMLGAASPLAAAFSKRYGSKTASQPSNNNAPSPPSPPSNNLPPFSGHKPFAAMPPRTHQLDAEAHSPPEPAASDIEEKKFTSSMLGKLKGKRDGYTAEELEEIKRQQQQGTFHASSIKAPSPSMFTSEGHHSSGVPSPSPLDG